MIKMEKKKNEFKILKSFERYGIKAGKRIHAGWEEWNDSKKKINLTQSYPLNWKPLGYYGKWQYYFTSPKGTFSLIKLHDYYRLGQHIYEIYCVEWKGKGSQPNIEMQRFFKKEEAIKEVVRALK